MWEHVASSLAVLFTSDGEEIKKYSHMSHIDSQKRGGAKV